jgi:hypothetical protein
MVMNDESFGDRKHLRVILTCYLIINVEVLRITTINVSISEYKGALTTQPRR